MNPFVAIYHHVVTINHKSLERWMMFNSITEKTYIFIHQIAMIHGKRTNTYNVSSNEKILEEAFSPSAILEVRIPRQ